MLLGSSMNKLLAVVALAAATSTGCFTAAGALIGSQSTNREVQRLPDGSSVTVETNNVAAGVVVGAALDLLALYAASQIDLGGSCFTVGPGEGTGGC